MEVVAVVDVNKCLSCEYIGDMTFYWLIINEELDKTLATYELSDEDINKNDELIEVICCPICGADQ